MPRGDGTGPMGMGPMTGRAAGYCAGYGAPGFMNPGGRGLGMAWGRGGGRGMAMAWRRGWARVPGGSWGFAPAPVPGVYPAPELTPEEEIGALRRQADWLKQQTDAINARIQELQGTKD